jgi:hypothetical protein
MEKPMKNQRKKQGQQLTFTHFRSWLAPPGTWIWRHPPKPPDKYQFTDMKLEITPNDKHKQLRSQS